MTRRRAPARGTRFKFTTEIEVRNYEVDWQGIVHNANYLLYFETGRIAYLRHIGLPVDMASIMGRARVVLVRNEVNYRAPARFGDRLTVLTRVSAIGTTSFIFEGEIRRRGELIAENKAVHVWLHGKSGRPVRVKEQFRRAVGVFEGEHAMRAPESPGSGKAGRTRRRPAGGRRR